MAESERNALIEPDLEHEVETSASDDNDSAFDSDDARSEIASLTSEITDYVYKNGRRYSALTDAKYRLPNDERECDRNDLVHHIYGMLLGGRLVFSPVGDKPSRILDVGCGTGIWANDVGDLYPSAEVIGTDISPIQPPWVPPNVQFIVENAEEEWQFKTPFDLIHFQNLNGSISNWPRLIKQIYENLKPGGYIEAKETDAWATSDDDTIPASSNLMRWQERCFAASRTLGLSPTAPEQLKQWITDAGFVDVQERQFKLPFNEWPKNPELKQVGRYQLVQYLDALEPYALGLLVEVLGWSREEVEVFLVGLRRDLKDRRIHGYNVL
ncbi:putative tam domain methyltransferase protein [Neofusicoccum parvum]|uniref:Tam domain methyltransferase protein n=1 Tax=Neofusicoccum parvum TaxID=310453 RepID=A0ACB5SJI9_9PEZI|nr:putative tam domain methyltransferase protein [Neofusicoccum parvum]